MSRPIKFTAFLLLAVVFFIPFFSALNFSVASDEITHLPSGYSYWKTGLIELNPQHPPLVKLMASFPMLLMDIKFDSNDPNLVGPFKDEWKFGQKLLFSNDVDKLLFWGRIPIMFLSLLLGVYLYRWASEMFSPKAGVLALFIYAFMPIIIANSMFITMDLAVTAFSFITLYYLWKFFRITRIRYLILSGLFLGLALGSKFSAVLLFPMIITLFLLYFYFKKEALESKINQATKWFIALLGISFGIIYIIYLMPLDFSFYLKGMKMVYADWGDSYKFYLNGSFSRDGWWYYFLLAFLIKTPIPFLIVFSGAIIAMVRRKYELNILDKSFLLMPPIIFSIITSMKAGNISIRYLLPIYPFLILFVGGFCSEILNFKFKILNSDMKIKTASALIFISAGWYVFSALHIYPDYIAYFNEFIGGPKNGYKYLDDSNLEWGHDLKSLAVYQKQHPAMKVLYSWEYSDLAYYGVKNVLPKEQESFLDPSGRYAVNIHFLVRLKELSRRYNNKNLDWLSLYKPVDMIGYSFLVYEFK